MNLRKTKSTSLNLRKPTSPPLPLRGFQKPTSPPLPLREGPPLISVFSPQGRRGNRPTRCSNRFAIWMADHQRSTPAAKLRLFVRDEPQGHTMQDVCSMLMEPHGYDEECSMLIARNLLRLLLMGTQGPMLDAVRIILFIRLWTGLTLERFPSGLWRKSCDRHWHLMNGHNDRDYHL